MASLRPTSSSGSTRPTGDESALVAKHMRCNSRLQNADFLRHVAILPIRSNEDDPGGLHRLADLAAGHALAIRWSFSPESTSYGGGTLRDPRILVASFSWI